MMLTSHYPHKLITTTLCCFLVRRNDRFGVFSLRNYVKIFIFFRSIWSVALSEKFSSDFQHAGSIDNTFCQHNVYSNLQIFFSIRNFELSECCYFFDRFFVRNKCHLQREDSMLESILFFPSSWGFASTRISNMKTLFYSENN